MSRQVLRFDRDIGHRLIARVQTRGRQAGAPYLMRTNSAGFRTGDYTADRPPERRRILVFGDSFTEGVGVSDGRRYSDLLEQLVPDVEVLNFGLRATGTDQQYLLFRELPSDLEYDLVVLGLYTADIKRAASKYGVLTTATGETFQKPYFQLDDRGELELHNAPVPTEAVDYASLDGSERKLAYHAGLAYRLRLAVSDHAPWAKAALQRLTRYQPAPYLGSAEDPSWRLGRAIVERWASELHVPMVVLAIPPYQYVEKTAGSTGYRERFAELGTSPGLTVHDPLDDLLAAARASGAAALRIQGDAHYAAAGHEVLARSLAPVVERVLGPVQAATGGVA